MIEPDICLWHGPSCQDGQTAAWAIWQRWKNCEFVPAQYGDAPPDVTGKNVLIVDFSYPRLELEGMAEAAKSLTILDHHKTAKEDLEPLLDIGMIRGVFDMAKSGAMLAWEYAWPHMSPPLIVQHVQDRDLWLFKMEETRALSAVLHSHEFTFETWTRLGKQIESYGDRVLLLREGEAILRDRDKFLVDILKATARWMVIGGHTVPVANVPYAMASDGAGMLAEGNPFAATYVDLESGMRQFSLRRRDGNVDVSEIASMYGGGGHAAAAGFTAPPGWEGEFPNPYETPPRWPSEAVITGNEPIPSTPDPEEPVEKVVLTASGKKIEVL